MSSYRTRPVYVDARQFDGTTGGANELIIWLAEHGADAHYQTFRLVRVLAGRYWQTARTGDWLVLDVAHETFSVVGHDEFAARYEPAP